MTYLDTKGKYTPKNTPTTTLEFRRELSDEEVTKHRNVGNILAWLDTGTSPTPAYLASMQLHGKTNEEWLPCCKAIIMRKETSMLRKLFHYTTFRYNLTTYMSLFTHTVNFRILLISNLIKIGFLFILIDVDNRYNIFQ